MKTYTVYLFYAPECIRHWLAYVQNHDSTNATVAVKVQATSSAKAKNAAVTAANKKFEGVEIVRVNKTAQHWGASNFPELAYLIA